MATSRCRSGRTVLADSPGRRTLRSKQCPAADQQDAPGFPANDWFTDDLWDGDALDEACTAAGGTGTPRHVVAQLPQASSEPIEVRLMCNLLRTNEDVAVRTLQLWLR